MAVIRPITARQGIDIGGVPNTRLDDSVGRGLQQIGSSLSQASDVIAAADMRRAQMKAQADDFRADQGLRRFNDDMSLEFAKTQQGIDPSGEGFTDTVSTTFNQRAEQFLKTVPPELQGKFGELVRTSRETWVNKAAAAEIDQRNTWYRDGITKAQEGLQTQVFNDPALYAAAKDDGFRAIDSSGLPQTEKKKLKEAWEQTLSNTIGEREIREAEADPKTAKDAAQRLGVSGASPVEQVVSRIIGAESGGNPNAQNPKSSASGVGQFTDSTWLATVRKHRPDLAGASNAQILSLKNDAALGREMTTRLTEDNAQDLGAAGLPVTPGSLYLAHFAGIGGAKEVLQAPGNAALVDVLGPKVIAANGFLRGKTASWLISWADGKMKGGATPQVPSDPRYASLSLTERLKIYDQVQAAAQRGQTAIDVQTKAAYEQAKGALQLGIQTGDVSSPQQILSSAMDDGDKATLISALRARQDDAMATGDAVKLFGQGQLSVDPYDAKGKKTVDNVWNAVSSSVAPDQLQPTVEELVRQSGTVPQGVINQIRQGLASGNVQVVAQAAQSAQRISTVDSAALGRRDGGSEAQKAADDFSYYVDKLNLSPEDAARRLIENRDPAKQRDRKAIEPAAKEFVKSMQDIDLAGEFNDSWFAGDPSLGFTPSQELGVKADFLAIAEDQFFRANGDPEIAKNRAVEEMKRLYGVTEFGGVKAVVKHPPERYWPTSRFQEEGKIGAEQSLDYARKQLQADVTAIEPTADLSTIQLITTPETDAMVKRGELPGYAILYKDANGMFQTVPGKLWRPDVSKAVEVQQGIDVAKKVLDVSEARKLQTQERQQLPFRQQGMDDFLSGNDPVFGARDAAPTSNPSPMPKPDTAQNRIQGQRQQLFNDARDSGILPGGQ